MRPNLTSEPTAAALSGMSITQMKTSLMILLVPLAVLTGCSHSTETTTPMDITGTWYVNMNDGGKSTHTFSADGNFKCRTVSSSGSEIDIGGTYKIESGFLVETVTNVTPSLVMQFKIVQSDDQKVVVLKDGIESTMKKTPSGT